MEKEDILKALEAYLIKDCNPYLSGAHSFDKQCFHSEAWRTGGVGGGSCWDEGDDDPHYDLSEEEPLPIENLERFLEDFYPHLSLSQYKEITNHIHEEGWTDYEYYGNYTNYSCYYINFEDIANTLIQLKKPQIMKIYR